MLLFGHRNKLLFGHRNKLLFGHRNMVLLRKGVRLAVYILRLVAVYLTEL